jgi:SAM-dependent methyltransferase
LTGPAGPRGRSGSFGQHRKAGPVDRFGVWLSLRAVRRHASFDDARVLDVGCGYEASATRAVLGQASDATVLDLAITPELRDDPRVTVLEGSIDEHLPALDDARYDVVLCLSVLEHLWEPDVVLRHLRRVTKPGGVVLLNVPSWRGKRFLELAAFRLGVSPAEEMDDHKRYYDPRDLWPMLVQAGFKPSRIDCRKHKFGLNTFAACRRDDEEDHPRDG